MSESIVRSCCASETSSIVDSEFFGAFIFSCTAQMIAFLRVLGI